MKIEINVDEKELSKLVSEYLVKEILRDYRVSPESREAVFGIRSGVDKAIKEYIYTKKESIIERVIERASIEIVKKGLPKFLDKIN
jgi:hypothetical protein